jgi:hypothetical protein
MKKMYLGSVVMGLLVLAAAVNSSSVSFADEQAFNSNGNGNEQYQRQDSRQEGRHRRHRRRHEFMRGVCVGQALAAAGVTLPAPQAGQKPVWDAATKAAFKAAMESCRPAPAPAPSPSPSAPPAPAAPVAPTGQ